MQSASRVLVVDDDPACLRILQKFLEKDGYEVICAADGYRGLEKARALKPDLIICDWMMPGLDGPQVCQTVKADPALKDTFFIFLTAMEKSYIAAGISQGADDFITKPIDPLVVRAKVQAGLRLSLAQKALLDQAHRDVLTGAYNRRYWEDTLRGVCRGGPPFLLALLDVDRLKEINDSWGHQVGDGFLKELVRVWAANLDEGEILARLGGDEFACLFHRSLTCLRNLRRKVEKNLAATFPQLPVGISLGYALFQPGRPLEASALMAQADHRLYREKRRRRNAPP
jgi:diguanylate cyclase (GGDEF)-like protein